MTLLYSSFDRETHSSKTDRCMTLALSCRNSSAPTGLSSFHSATATNLLRVLCRHESGVESAHCTLHSAASVS